MIERHCFAAEVPPRVEYILTEKGHALLPVIDCMREFGRQWLPDESCDDATIPDLATSNRYSLLSTQRLLDGMSTSCNPSTSNWLNASTVNVSAMPGNVVYHQASRK